ncbi:MAG: GrpB family protein [Asgard group archaeon]|nr:GrpB family protein [Asgard group archaeon]
MSEQVIVEEYNPNWKSKYSKIREDILEKIGDFVVEIEHIGSTAIPGLASKPIIDVMIGTQSLEDADKCIPRIIEMNFEYVKEHEKVLPNRRFFRKPVKGLGQREYHIHMVVFNDEFWKRQLLFRDYLITHPKVLKAYEELKRKLALKFKDNRQAYSDGKDDFIQKILIEAQNEFELQQ